MSTLEINLFIESVSIEQTFDLPRETIQRIASTTCVKGVKLLIKRITGGMPSAGHITPKAKLHRLNPKDLIKITNLNSII